MTRAGQYSNTVVLAGNALAQSAAVVGRRCGFWRRNNDRLRADELDVGRLRAAEGLQEG